jgi:hypothetical protein
MRRRASLNPLWCFAVDRTRATAVDLVVGFAAPPLTVGRHGNPRRRLPAWDGYPRSRPCSGRVGVDPPASRLVCRTLRTGAGGRDIEKL